MMEKNYMGKIIALKKGAFPKAGEITQWQVWEQ